MGAMRQTLSKGPEGENLCLHFIAPLRVRGGGQPPPRTRKGAIKCRQRFSPSGPFDKVCLVAPFYFIQKRGKFQKVIYTGDNLLYDEHNTGPRDRKGPDK